MALLLPRFFDPPNQSYFLFGPRGTGKSTFLKYTYPDALYIDLLKPDIQRQLSAAPERIIEQVHACPVSSTIIIDEIQKVPSLLDAVHSLIEEKNNWRFILTGSSARKLKRSGIDLLAGRVLIRQMHPFLLSEMGSHSDFIRALNTGTIPLIIESDDPEETLQTYISLYIREEVQYEGLVRHMGNFNRFLEAISFSHGAVLNISNVARECSVQRKVVENYVSILEDILIGSRLPVFKKRAQRAVTAHPKFYFFDTGVFKALRPRGPLDLPSEIDGSGLEGLVFQHLQAWNSYANNPYTLYFWRSRGNVEVDFVLYGSKDMYAIEVKNTGTIRQEDLSGLREFNKDYPQTKSVFLYRGKTRLLKNNILCLPCDEFLRAVHPGRSMDDILGRN